MVTMASTQISAYAKVKGWVTAATASGDVFPVDVTGITDWSLAGWIDVDRTATGTDVVAIDMASSAISQSVAERQSGALGIDMDGGGRAYAQPSFAVVAASGPSRLTEQGAVHLAMVVEQVTGDTRRICFYVNGVPMLDQEETIVAPSGSVLREGQDATGTDRWANVAFYDRALTDSEVSAMYLSERGSLGVSAPEIMIVGSFDSLTAFSPAPFWDLCAAASLRPGTFGMLDAAGGSRYGSGAANAYDNADRQGLRRRTLAAAAAHFQEVIWLCAYGTNDLVGGVMDPATTTWQAGRDTIDGMIAADIASVSASVRSRIKPILVTIIPHSGWIEGGADAADLAREVARQAYNADCLANYASRGYTDVIDPASYTPSGFADMEAAALDAFTNGENAMYAADGIHYSDAGGATMAAAVHIPLVAARLAAL